MLTWKTTGCLLQYDSICLPISCIHSINIAHWKKKQKAFLGCSRANNCRKHIFSNIVFLSKHLIKSTWDFHSSKTCWPLQLAAQHLKGRPDLCFVLMPSFHCTRKGQPWPCSKRSTPVPASRNKSMTPPLLSFSYSAWWDKNKTLAISFVHMCHWGRTTPWQPEYSSSKAYFLPEHAGSNKKNKSVSLSCSISGGGIYYTHEAS